MPDSSFDSLGAAIFGVCKTVFGSKVPARWTPSAGGAAKTATVLLGDPTRKSKLEDAEYSPERPWIEYAEGDFAGLYEAVRTGLIEKVVMDSTEYYVRSVERGFDGKCLKAFIENV
jgi:hypothetical protein